MRKAWAFGLAALVAGIALAATASAAAYDVAANCVNEPISYQFDGKFVVPQVANGNPAGFLCNGTTYVPLRFMAQALGKAVDWNWTGSRGQITVTTPPSSNSTSAPADIRQDINVMVADGYAPTQPQATLQTASGPLYVFITEPPGASGLQRLFFFLGTTQIDPVLGGGSFMPVGTLGAAFIGPASTTSNGAILVTFPGYRPGDALCCPSGAPINVTYQWTGAHLVASQATPEPQN